MESIPIYSEKIVPKNKKMPLYKRDSYVCILSGSKWNLLKENILHEMKNILRKNLSRLIYLPEIFKTYSNEVLEYNFPGIQLSDKMHHNMFMYKILGIIEENLKDNDSIMIRYDCIEREFKYYKFKADTDYEFLVNARSYLEWVINNKLDALERIPAYCRRKRDSGIKFCISTDDNDSGNEDTLLNKSIADREFTSEQNQLIDMAIDAVAKLQLQGISLEIIKELITQKIELSRLIITEKYKVILPDYNNKEVIMGPLPKTIFLFFLKHNREFMFSDLMDYKDELLSIYEKISNRGDKEQMIKSIEQLTDPTNNSICEKCSAVRKAFLEQITYDVARNYFIEGTQGMPKKICLDRNLVDWKVKI